MESTYTIRGARADDMTTIIALIAEAADWLQGTKDTDQWSRPWPDRDARDERISRGIEDGRTWMVGCGTASVGSVTFRQQGNPKLWQEAELSEPAVYVSRLMVSRAHAGHGIGAALIDWAGQRGELEWGAKSIRVDVWTTNAGLHKFYRRQGFARKRTYDFDDPWEYPSAALFEKPIAAIDRMAAALFREERLALIG